MLQVDVGVEGLTQILMHNPVGMQVQGIRTKQIPTPEEEAKLSAYQLEDGRLYIQTIAFRSSIIAGAGPFKLGKASLKSQLSGMIVSMEPEDILLLERDGKPITEYDIDLRRAVVQGQGIIRARAKIELPWAVSWKMSFDENLLPKQHLPTIQDLINRAGSVIGVCDFRPGSPKNKSGWFGKYRVTKFEENGTK